MTALPPRTIPVDHPALLAAVEALHRVANHLPKRPLRDEVDAALAALRAEIEGAT